MLRSWSKPRTSTVSLVLANAVPLLGVVGFGWDLHALLNIYWLESGKPNREIVAFFTAHYGASWAIHGAFVFAFFPAVFPDTDPASPWIIGLTAVGLTAYHAVSYWINYVGEREYERSGPVTLMIEPYRRVLVLHLTIVLGAFAVAMIGAPVGAVAVMVLVKTILDLRGHWREHDRARRRGPPTAPIG